MPSTIWYASGDDIKDNIKYKYDKSGNICEITENGHIVARYAYDGLNRLVREDNKPLNKTVVYTYDNCGNITERCEYAYTRKSGEELTELECTHFAYEYDGDRLVSYNGEKCEYNNNGCPHTYRNKSLEWRFGTRVAYLGGISYEHDGFGKRIKKNNTEFVYDSDGRLIKQSNGLEFIYDDKQVIALEKEQIRYFYRRDIQGNIIAILDESGAVVVRYIYDAWGNHAVVDANGNDIEDMSHIGNVNPFRYRGYYYDVETGFYYLKSRYYDPETGRFISQDSTEYASNNTVNGLNLYCYCLNNPIKYVDFSGCIPFANSFIKNSVTHDIFGFNNFYWGRLLYSTTILENQSEETGFLYAYSAYDLNGDISHGVGINFWSWLGVNLGVNTTKLNIFAGLNITPWIHANASLGLDGITLSLGIMVDDVSHDFSIGIGLGPILIGLGLVALIGSMGQGASPIFDFFAKIFSF